jgi:hypothetical protein
MIEDLQGRRRRRRRLRLALAALAVILAVLLVPPLISINHYKGRITQLISASLDRPVHLSSVEARLLPWPGFVLNDLSVEEDPAYGAEPVLHANTVTASIRLLPLWRGRIEISKISVDEASLNLVHSAPGTWNLDPLFRTAAARAGQAINGGGSRRGMRLPYLEATNSRINIKNGAEKLPFSLVNTDLSFWQEDSGDWRIRLRGQPARTDVSLDLADTGIVQLEASVRRAPELRQMPVHLDLEWRQAQLGQLAKLLTGSDPGWRGDLTAELHLDGTPDAARITTRLRAAGVHRVEFSPAVPMDFDANCGFVYHYSNRALDDLTCDSPLGNGHIHLAGDLPGDAAPPRFSVALDRVPAAAGLELLRTIRNGVAPDLDAEGTVSGEMSYAENAPESGESKTQSGALKLSKAHSGAQHPAPSGPLDGSFRIEGFQLSGGGLSAPLQATKITLEPVTSPAAEDHRQALAGVATIAAGGTEPLTIGFRLGSHGYQVTAHGQASLARAKELANITGMAESKVFDALAAAEPIAVDLSAQGPWLPAQGIEFTGNPPVGVPGAGATAMPALVATESPLEDSLSGTVTVHNANWKADYLASHVLISEATLHLGNGGLNWSPIAFSYGPVKGTASLSLPASCDTPEPCPAHFQVQFGVLDASALQAAILGAHEHGTLLSSLLNRLNPSPAPAWPRMEGTVKADSLLLGPVTLQQPTAALQILPTGIEITNLNADMLGGQLQASGTLKPGGNGQVTPEYSLEGSFAKLSAPTVGQLLGQRWSGGRFNASGKIELSGYTAKDLAGSAKGTLHFEWLHGAVAQQTTHAGDSSRAEPIPVALARFDRWSAAATITNGAMTLQQNQLVRGVHKGSVEGKLTFGDPPRISFAISTQLQEKTR